MIVAYLAGKYSGNTEKNIADARKVAIWLWEQGYAVVCPHLNTAHFEKDCACTYDQYLVGYIAIMQKCDLVIMLPGWFESPGAKQELDSALRTGMEVLYLKAIENGYFLSGIS